jgi:hypothetical protein
MHMPLNNNQRNLLIGRISEYLRAGPLTSGEVANIVEAFYEPLLAHAWDEGVRATRLAQPYDAPAPGSNPYRQTSGPSATVPMPDGKGGSVIWETADIVDRDEP